ncbi:MAG: hypothetical protein H8E94_09530 [Alphaproteobacteria bacterium]|nr:hypothetical protein [Alphaproteobacteria bacterium]
MQSFFKKHGSWLKNASFVGMIAIPFLLYFAAMNDAMGLVYGLLGAMGLSMLVAMKVG